MDFYPDDAWLPCKPYQRSLPGKRHPDMLRGIVAQFDVAHRVRYQPKRDAGGHLLTYCNIFVSDVTDALMAPIPHWVKDDNRPADCGKGHELGANGTVDWLHDYSVAKVVCGWDQITEEQAEAAAALGKPTVATWRNDHPNGGSGHIGLLVPPLGPEDGIHIAQAGLHCFSYGTLASGFGPVTPYVKFWGHE